MRCLSVRPSGICHVGVFCRNELNISVIFFHHRVNHTGFSIPNVVAIFRRGPSNWGKNRDFRSISGISHRCIIPSRVVNILTVEAFVDRGRRTTHRRASANRVYDRSPRRYTPDTTEQNLIVRIGISEAVRSRYCNLDAN